VNHKVPTVKQVLALSKLDFILAANLYSGSPSIPRTLGHFTRDTTMPSKSTMPDFGPIPDWAMDPLHREPGENRTMMHGWDAAARHLTYVQMSDRYTKSPSSWGYNLYRAVDGPGTDERFEEAVRRLTAWVQWMVKQFRYHGFSEGEVKEHPERLPIPGEPHPSDELARRFYLEVIEDYPNRDQVRAGLNVEEGDENFTPVGAAFLDWVDENALEVDDLYVRNDHCLVIDERSLVSLEALPDVPPVSPQTAAEERDLFPIKDKAWVWLVDRETTLDEMNGEPPLRLRWMEPDHPSFRPWCRIELANLVDLWFGRPQGHCIARWVGVLVEDSDITKFGKVRWWLNVGAQTENALRAAAMKRKREANAEGA